MYSLYSYSIPFSTPLKIKGGVLNERNGIIIKYQQNYAEIAPLKYFSAETFEEALKESKKLIRALSINQTFTPKCPSVQFGLFCLNNPLNNIKRKTPYSTLFQSPSEILKIIQQQLIQPTQTIKIKVGLYDFDKELEVIQQLDKLNFKYIIDANLSITNKQLDELLCCSQKGLVYIEDPTNDIGKLSTLNVCIGLDELYRFNKINANRIPRNKIIIKPTMTPINKSFLQTYKPILSSSFESIIGISYIEKLSSFYNLPSPGTDTLKYFSCDCNNSSDFLTMYCKKI